MASYFNFFNPRAYMIAHPPSSVVQERGGGGGEDGIIPRMGYRYMYFGVL